MRISNILTRLYQSKPAKAYMNAMEKKEVTQNGVKKVVDNFPKLQKIYPPIFMCFLALSQCGFLATSKEMPKERKIPLIFNNIYSCIIALGIGAVSGKHINKLTDHFVKRAGEIYGKDSRIINGIKNGIPILKEAILFEYVGYVAAVPLGTQTTNWLAKKGIIKFDNKPNNRDNK